MGARAPMIALRRGDAVVNYHEVDVGDGVIRVALAGEGLPIIMLHGWTLDHRMWTPQISDLAEDFLLVMPDRRGFGGSTAPPDLTREADDIDRIADLLGSQQFALLGLSQGAAVALDYAARAGNRAVAVIACGAPLPALVDREEVLDIALYRRLAKEANLAALRADWATHPLMQAHSDETQRALDEMLADYEARDLQAPSVLPDLGRAVLSRLAMPVLGMTGTVDTPWRRACATALAQAAPHGEFALIEQAGHVANLDNPDSFNRILANFLQPVAV